MAEIAFLIPEIILTLTLAGMTAAEIAYHGERLRLVSTIALLGIAAALIHLWLSASTFVPTKILSNALSIDGMSFFFKLFFIFLAGLAVVISIFSKELVRGRRTEFYMFVVAGAIAMSLISSAADLLVVFLSLQFFNVIVFFLAGYSKQNIWSTEASVKYMIFSVVSGALFIYAGSILFTFTKTLNMYEMHKVLALNPMPAETGLIIFGLLFLSLCFYFGAFPMHLWVPDVLDGVPTPTSVFVALGAPVVGFAVAIRLFVVVFAQPSIDASEWKILGNLNWMQIVALASGATMLTGSFLAVRQKSMKRLLACLVMAQTGFFLLGLLVLDRAGLAALLYNLVVHLFALVGIFCAVSYMFDLRNSDRLRDFKGVLGEAMPETICLLIFMACFVGLPPLPGFIGKFLLIGAVVRDQWFGLAVIAIFATVLAIGVFARTAFSLAGNLEEPPSDRPVLAGGGLMMGQRWFLIALLGPVVFLSVFADPVVEWIGQFLRFILW